MAEPDGRRTTTHASQGLKLGILDFGMLGYGDKTPRRALEHIQARAVAAEAVGYSRFWLAEHHVPEAAESSPEVMLGLIASRTKRILVGSGGVLLPYYSPLKVAGSFRVLSALFPKRIELGIGRGPGVADARTAHELVHGEPSILDPKRFEEKVGDLCAYLNGGFPPSHPKAGIRAYPMNVPPPPVWVLGNGPRTMALAAERGVGLAVGRFLSKSDLDEVVQREYVAQFRPSASFPKPRTIVAVTMICMGREPMAREANARLVDAGLASAQVVGDPQQCHEQLQEIARRYGTSEILLGTTLDRPSAALKSFTLLAKAAFGSRKPQASNPPPRGQ